MRVIDMHLNPLARPQLERVETASATDLAEACQKFGEQFVGLGIERGVVVLLNPKILESLGRDPSALTWLRERRFAFAYAPDFRRADALERLSLARELGVRALKFHPYLQQIEPADFDQAVTLAKTAEAFGMFVMVCCSYGTRALDRYSGVRLAACLSEQIACPIVMSHAGGARIMDAMLVAADAPNVYLDTSYSLPYYLGSSVEGDFAFAMRKLGTGRWVYGSDAPFDELTGSLEVTRRFLELHRFSAREMDDVLYATAAGILDGSDASRRVAGEVSC